MLMWNIYYNIFLDSKSYRMENSRTQCFICGNINCQEEVDHQRMTSHQFYELLQRKAGYSSQIAHLKVKIEKAFNKLKRRTNEQLEPFQMNLSLLVDKLHFWYLLSREESLKNIEAVIFGYMLPRNQLIKLIMSLSSSEPQQPTFPCFKQLLEEVHWFKKNSQKIIDNHHYDHLFSVFSSIIYQCEKEQVNKRLRRQATMQMKIENDAIQIVMIEGVPFSIHRTQVDLSVLELSDEELISYIPALQKMKDLKQLSIGNNHLKPRTYRMLFNAIPQIECLDLRNSDSDNFIEMLTSKLPHLKGLYCNQTNFTNHKLDIIMNSLPQLRVLYLDQNEISSEKLLQVTRKLQSLQYISAKKVNMNEEDINKIRELLGERGGYLWY